MVSALVTVLAAKGTSTSDNLADMLEFGPRLGLRPCEFFGTKLEGAVLKVRSAKFSASNGRGIAQYRPITLCPTGFDEFDFDALRRLLERLAHELKDVDGNMGLLVRRYAAAMRRARLDRLVHNAHRLTLNGDSMRKAAAKRSGLDASPAP